MNIHELAQLTGKDLVIVYSPLTENYRARFERCEIKRSSILSSASGTGVTPNEAIRNYCAQIEGETIVFDAYDKEKRLELNVPGNLNPV